eukprot:s804_g18.t1
MEADGKAESSPDFEGEEAGLEAVAKALPAKQAEVPTAGDKVSPQPDQSTSSSSAKGDGKGGAVDQGDGDKAAGEEEPWVPDRVKKALEKSSSFDEFRKNRPFRFLHMFSGEKDQLGESLKKEAKAARLEIYVESLDRKRDHELNLASHETYDVIDQAIEGEEFDAFHSGFPCSSFSKVRWRHAPGASGPMPVRSADHIYGLPGNSVHQQKEADEGTLMATRSAWLHQKQIKACKRRKVPETSTLENPPGSKDSGSAWDLPEIQEVMKVTRSSSVEFNTCAYQTKLKKRWFKPARWVGKLESMGSLAKVCKCPAWVEHVPLIGKQNTEAAGAYPEELTDEIAKKIVSAWKRVLNLEWLRFQMKQKADQVNSLQSKWLANEEKKRKREYEEAEPIAVNPLSHEPKFSGGISKTTENKEEEKEELPSSSAGPSKRQRREEQNDFFIGGMRNPASAVARLHQVKRTGEEIHAAWLNFVQEYPSALEAAVNYGSQEAQLDETITKLWRTKLESLLGAVQQEGVTLKEAVEFQSPLYAPLWDAWRVQSRDPEQFIGQWAREGVPLGMDRQIPDSGIFPQVDADEPSE